MNRTIKTDYSNGVRIDLVHWYEDEKEGFHICVNHEVHKSVNTCTDAMFTFYLVCAAQWSDTNESHER